MSTSNVFEEASKLRTKHPRKYKEWQQYVSWATRLRKGGGKKKKVSGTRTKKHRKQPSIGKAREAPKAIGSIAFHKRQARKQLEEKLAWLLLARDQEKRKKERVKLSKKVAQLRQEIHNLK